MMLIISYDYIMLVCAGKDFKIIGVGSAAGKGKLLYFPQDNDGNVIPRCWDAYSGVEVDLMGTPPLQSALKGDGSPRMLVLQTERKNQCCKARVNASN